MKEKTYEQWMKDPIAECKPVKEAKGGKSTKRKSGGAVSNFSGSNGPPPTHD